ncbi:MAG: CoA-binding protein [Bacteroidota bacterium]|jgi:predicted CoA-binding protein|nr:CoA-binding protein [Bacteroidota bacterium]
MKKTVVIGASPNPSRFAYLAVNMLKNYGHETVPVGIKKGSVAGIEILDLKDKPSVENTDTVTLYLGPQNQKEWIDYILSLRPKRIIFNPGTENWELEEKARENDIETLDACTLVMLRSGQY